MAKLILLIVSELCFLYSFLSIKKSSRKQSLIVWIGLAILMQYILNAIIGGVYGLFHISICCYTVFPVVLIISAGLFLICKKHGRQEYYIDKIDTVFIILLICITFLFWIGYFRLNLLVRFVSVDASVHARFAKQIAFEHTISNNMFLPYLNDGLFMDALLFLTGSKGIMHCFVFMRIVDFFVGGLSFFGILKVYCTKHGRFPAIVITLLYLCGYPLYVLIFGFVYFGASVTMIVGLLTVCKLYSDIEKKYKHIYILLLNCFLFAVFTTYTLFVPSVFLGLFLYHIYKLYVESNLSLKHFIRIEAETFIFPCIFGMIYAFGNLKEMQGGSGGAISAEGGKYFDLYSNFLFLIPFAISGLYKQIQNKKEDITFFLLLTALSFTLLLFGLSLKGKVSIYYLSKMYNILWMLSWIYVYIEIENILCTEKAFISTFAIEFIFLIFLSFIRFDDKLNRDKTYVISGSDNFVNIYYFNSNFLLNQGFLDGRISGSAEIVKEKIGNKSGSMLLAGNEINSNWFKTYYGNCDINGSQNVSSVLDEIKENDYMYLCYENDAFSSDDIEILKKLGENVCSTDFATVIELK